MTSIVPHIAAATFITMSSLRHQTPLATSKQAVHAVGPAAMVVVVLIGAATVAIGNAVVRGLAEAARGIGQALAALARVGAMLMSALLLLALGAVVVLGLLILH